MNQTYLNSAKSAIKYLKSDVTDNSIINLTVVTSMGVGTSLLGLIDATSWPTISEFGIAYFFILIIIGWTANTLMTSFKERKKYKISDIDYDKDIK